MIGIHFFTLFLLISPGLVSASGFSGIQIPEYAFVPIIVEDENGVVENYLFHLSKTCPNYPCDFNRTWENQKSMFFAPAPSEYDPQIYTLWVESGAKKSGILNITQQYINERIDPEGKRYPLKIRFILDDEGSVSPEIILSDLEIAEPETEHTQGFEMPVIDSAFILVVIIITIAIIIGVKKKIIPRGRFVQPFP